MKTAVVGMCVPATAAFCVNIIFFRYFHSDSPKVKENGNTGQPEKEAQMKTAVVGMCVPATAAFCVNIIFFRYFSPLIIFKDM